MADDKYTVLDEHGLQTLLENLTSKVKDEITQKSIYFGTCDTDGTVVAKTATVTGDFVLQTGVIVALKMKTYNAASAPTLSVNGSTAKLIKRYGTTAPGASAAGSWNGGSVVIFIYDGTYWQMAGWLNTTYSVATDSTNGLMSKTDKAAHDDMVATLEMTTAEFTALDTLLDE